MQKQRGLRVWLRVKPEKMILYVWIKDPDVVYGGDCMKTNAIKENCKSSKVKVVIVDKSGKFAGYLNVTNNPVSTTIGKKTVKLIVGRTVSISDVAVFQYNNEKI